MLLFFSFLFSLLLQQPPSAGSFTLKVSVTGVNQKGNLMAELRNEKNEVVKQIKQNLKTEGATLTFANLPKGRYAVALFHDENADGKLNTNMVGIPKEAYGFSNNARGTIGPPELKEQLFDLSGSRTLAIRVK